MKKILFVIFVSITQVFAQTNSAIKSDNTESYLEIWEDESKPDTSRLEALDREIQFLFKNANFDSALHFAKIQLDFAEAKNIKSHIVLAINNLGKIKQEKGDYKKAIDYYQQGLSIVIQLGNKNDIALQLNKIGTVYRILGKYNEALNYYQKSLLIQNELDNKVDIANLLNNIGFMHELLDNYTDALKYYEECLSIMQKSGSKVGVANSMNNIGYIHEVLDNYDDALAYYEKALKIMQEIGNKHGIAASFNNIGIYYDHLGDFEKALDYYQRSLEITKEIGDKRGIASLMINIGFLYSDLNQQTKGIELCERGLKMAEESGLIIWQKNACECLYESYKANNNWKSALEYLELKTKLHDSLSENESENQLIEFEFERRILQDSIANEKEKREIEVAHQKEIRKRNNTRNIAMGTGILVFLIALGLWSRLRYTSRTKKVIEKEKDRSENLLLNILPEEIAEELKDKGKAAARNFNQVSILFTDFKGFTAAASNLSPEELVEELNVCFEAFDNIMEKYGIEKIKTIGDAYMAAGGLPVLAEDSVKNTVFAALEMQEFILSRKKQQVDSNKPYFEMRAGIHTGPVVAGIVGVKKFQYDIWGDTVNTASRMESNGAVGKVNISQATYELLKNDSDFIFENRGKIEAKGKGEMEMYFVSKAFK
jgi:adenylate cyclase